MIPIISVIIPTYKPMAYLWRCLDSLKNQNLEHTIFEIIIILNGCNEPWKSEIFKYVKENIDYLNINFIQTDTPGVSNARNIGLNNAKGEYICFIDDDDTVSKDYLNGLYSCIKEENLFTIACSNVKTIKGNILGEDYITKFYNEVYSLNPKFSLFKYRHFLSSSCCKLIPMTVINKRRFPLNIKIGEDAFFMAKISDKISNIIISSPNAIYYRTIRLNSASRTSEKFIRKFKRKLNLIYLYIKTYLTNFPKYNLLFYLSRVIAIIKV